MAQERTAEERRQDLVDRLATCRRKAAMANASPWRARAIANLETQLAALNKEVTDESTNSALHAS